MAPLAKPLVLPRLRKLPRAPASDLKKLGWKGMMSTVRRQGKLLVTNHDEPEAVIILVAEYDELMQLVEESKARTETALQDLRQSFDKRLTILQDQSAGTRMRSIMSDRAKLGGKVKAGASY